MTINLESNRIEISCPSCSHKISKTLGELKLNKHIKCTSCGHLIQLENSNFKKGLQSAKKNIADFERAISKFGKK